MTISAARNAKKSMGTKSNVAAAGFDIPPAPPVTQLRSKNFRRNSLRCAAPPTPEQADFAERKSWMLHPGGTQNPPVLLPPEMVCSGRKHPLSSVSGRRRYKHTRLSNGKSCANRALSPLLETPNQRNLQSLYNPCRFETCTHKLKKGVCAYISQNIKIPTVDPPISRGKTVGIFNAAFIEWEIFMRQDGANGQFSTLGSF